MGGMLSKVIAIDFGIQWSAFALAAALKTERFYDFVGSSTFGILALYTLSNSKKFTRQIIISMMQLIWVGNN